MYFDVDDIDESINKLIKKFVFLIQWNLYIDLVDRHGKLINVHYRKLSTVKKKSLYSRNLWWITKSSLYEEALSERNYKAHIQIGGIYYINIGINYLLFFNILIVYYNIIILI